MNGEEEEEEETDELEEEEEEEEVEEEEAAEEEEFEVAVLELFDDRKFDRAAAKGEAAI